MDDDDGRPGDDGGDDDLLSNIMSRMSSVTVSSPEDLVKTFASVLSIPNDLAAFYLSAANGNLEIAINLWLDGSKSEQQPVGQRRPARALPWGARPAAPPSSGSGMAEDGDVDLGGTTPGAGGASASAFSSSAVEEQRSAVEAVQAVYGAQPRDSDLFAALQAGVLDPDTYAMLTGALHAERQGPAAATGMFGVSASSTSSFSFGSLGALPPVLFSTSEARGAAASTPSPGGPASGGGVAGPPGAGAGGGGMEEG